MNKNHAQTIGGVLRTKDYDFFQLYAPAFQNSK